jgi:hypothetical protein
MFSAVGGNLGLYIGASFMTFFEFGHLLCAMIWNISFGLPI